MCDLNQPDNFLDKRSIDYCPYHLFYRTIGRGETYYGSFPTRKAALHDAILLLRLEIVKDKDIFYTEKMISVFLVHNNEYWMFVQKDEKPVWKKVSIL